MIPGLLVRASYEGHDFDDFPANKLRRTETPPLQNPGQRFRWVDSIIVGIMIFLGHPYIHHTDISVTHVVDEMSNEPRRRCSRSQDLPVHFVEHLNRDSTKGHVDHDRHLDSPGRLVSDGQARIPADNSTEPFASQPRRTNGPCQDAQAGARQC